MTNHTVAMTTAEGYHTPNVNAQLRIFLALNLRDSMTEDNVRKRPFLLCKYDPYTLEGIQSRDKIKRNNRMLQENQALFFC